MLHFPKTKGENLQRRWQEEMIECHSLVCTQGPRTFSSSGSIQSSGTPLGTPQQQQQGCSSSSRAAPAHCWSFSASSSTILLPSLPHTALQSCREPPPRTEHFPCQELLTQAPFPPRQAGSAQPFQELPTASWRAMAGNHRLSPAQPHTVWGSSVQVNAVTFINGELQRQRLLGTHTTSISPVKYLYHQWNPHWKIIES